MLQERQASRCLASVAGTGSQQDWMWPSSIRDVLQLLRSYGPTAVRLVAGNTGPGVFKDWPTTANCVDLKRIPELHSVSCTQVG